MDTSGNILAFLLVTTGILYVVGILLAFSSWRLHHYSIWWALASLLFLPLPILIMLLVPYSEYRAFKSLNVAQNDINLSKRRVKLSLFVLITYWLFGLLFGAFLHWGTDADYWQELATGCSNLFIILLLPVWLWIKGQFIVE